MLTYPYVKLQPLCSVRLYVRMVCLSFPTRNPFFLLHPMSLESASGLIPEIKCIKSTQKFSLGKFWFFPRNYFANKICCAPQFICPITSGSTGLEHFISHPDLVSGLQTQAYTLLTDTALCMFHWSSIVGKSKTTSWVPFPHPMIPLLLYSVFH